MAENLLEMRKGTEDLCLRKYFGPRGLSAPAPGLYTKDGNQWQICYSNIRIDYSNIFEYSDRQIINVFIEISARRSSLNQGVL